MCVINLGKRVKGPVVAWKILRHRNKRFSGLMDFQYKIDKIHSSIEPGFQAFVNKEDAEKAVKLKSGEGCWLYNCVVRKVFLYDAAQGIINGMDGFSDGKSGWAARKIRIPRKRA
jgi:hypothetical protein